MYNILLIKNKCKILHEVTLLMLRSFVFLFTTEKKKS